MTITAAADGSALGNPGPVGWAWYIDDAHWASGGWAHGTNNQGELTAVLELLRATRSVADETLVIACDSKYVIDSLTKWMPGWKRNGWRKADKSPVLNRELLETLDAELTGRSVKFEWVKGHAGHPLNEAADERAQAAARAYQARVLPDAGPGFGALAPAAVAEPAAPLDTSGLFDDDWIDTDPQTVTLTLELSADEFSRLQSRARAAGTTPEDLLRSLM